MKNDEFHSLTGSQTAGSAPGKFDDVEVAPTRAITTAEAKTTEEEPKSHVAGFMKYTATFLEAVEQHKATAAMLFSLIGYVLIATFGEMKIDSFSLYVIFLFAVYALYKIVDLPIQGKILAASINKFLLVALFIALVIIYIQNRTFFANIYSQASGLFSQSSSSTGTGSMK